MNNFNNEAIKQVAWHLNKMNEKLKSKIDVRVVGWGDSVSLCDGVALIPEIYKGENYWSILQETITKINDISDGNDIFVAIESCLECEECVLLSVGIAKRLNDGFEIYKSNGEVIKCTTVYK